MDRVTRSCPPCISRDFSRPSLVVLRTLVGWHFLYEGYTKLLHPAWGQDGAPFRLVVGRRT